MTRAILDIDDAVVGTPPATQLDVHFALNIHEHEATGETDRDNDKFGPERPLKHASVDLFGRPVDQYIQRPYNTRDGNDVERHRAEDLTSLDLRHLQLLPL